VTFSYPSKKEVNVLKDVSIKIEKNQVVALVGKSGCGKSSIIALIERFYTQTEGLILFNGHDIRDFDPRWYKQQVGIVSQEPVLFSGTIRENICHGLEMEQVTDAMLDEACKKANAYSFIMDKSVTPQGYDTLVGERGIKLSGG